MLFERIDLSTKLGSFLTLREPFWIASSHHTSEPSAIDAWEALEPAALTLKTSKKHRIDEPEKKPLHFYFYPARPNVPTYGKSTYCDGPKHKEFLTYVDTKKLLDHAKAKLKRTEVGVSVLAAADEDYAELRRLCKDASFFELNLKYTFRMPKTSAQAEYLSLSKENFDAVLVEVKRFCSSNKEVPVFVKIPRELDWLPGTDEQVQLLDLLSEHGRAGIILTNSLKKDLTPFMDDGQEYKLEGGVMCGEALFDDTVDRIKNYQEPCKQRNIPIIASGGMVSEQHILRAFYFGASAVQLCTTFDYNRRTFYEALTSALLARIHLQGLSSFTEFWGRLPRRGLSVIYNVPFAYWNHFWSVEFQKHIKHDIRRSEVMDAVIISGFTLFDKWKEVLEYRFKNNLGLRLFLPKPNGEPFKAVHKAWGISEGPQLEARKSRVQEAAEKYRNLWKATAKDRRKKLKKPEDEAGFEIIFYDQCPFYSFYIFDDNAYLSMYPFIRPDEPQSPVYVFFRTSEEYDRLVGELEGIKNLALQTLRPSDTEGHQEEASSAGPPAS